ncbi:ciliary microtubule associated protein 1A-like [Lineus longissimus]|uniref:ciliary microtubule associated protein 1A-like n=1 Tax=Lineus longissimus TaxID=88925 RepID=UPI00315DA7F2
MVLGYPPTSVRGPIAAMYRSPGPCYGLPGLVGQIAHDPSSKYYRGPTYVFGQHHGKFTDDCSPGPCYYPDSRITRCGKDGSPHYSLHDRTQSAAPFKVPGPGTYSPEKSGPSAYHHHPEHSFGGISKKRSLVNTPAANCYTVPGMIGKTVSSSKRQAPCYSITGRSQTGSFHEDLRKTPGPGTYKITDPDIYKQRAPLYTLSAKDSTPGDNTRTPGPGAHSPEKVRINNRLAPAFSFGVRHSEYLTPLIINNSE